MSIVRRARGIGVGWLIVVLSAGVVAAAEPSLAPESAEPGIERATEEPNEPAPTAEDELEPVSEPVAEEDEGSSDDHGRKVSERAEGVTPEGYKNHGQYVSEMARSKAGRGDRGNGDNAGNGPPPWARGKAISERARGETPEGYKNHGQYVSELARGLKNGTDD